METFVFLMWKSEHPNFKPLLSKRNKAIVTITLTQEQIEANKRTASHFHDPFMTGDPTTLDAIVHANWINHPPNPQEAPGIEGFKGTTLFFHHAFPNIRFDIQEILADNDKVIVRTLIHGAAGGDFLGHAVAGKRIAFNSLEVHQFVDGKISETWHIQDYYSMLAELTIIPNAMGAKLDPYPAWT